MKRRNKRIDSRTDKFLEHQHMSIIKEILQHMPKEMLEAMAAEGVKDAMRLVDETLEELEKRKMPLPELIRVWSMGAYREEKLKINPVLSAQFSVLVSAFVYFSLKNVSKEDFRKEMEIAIKEEVHRLLIERKEASSC